MHDSTAAIHDSTAALHDTASHLQVSVARLAAQQDAHASRVQAHLDALAGGSARMRLTLEAAFEVMANPFDALESMERRLADLEAWRKKQAG